MINTIINVSAILHYISYSTRLNPVNKTKERKEDEYEIKLNFLV